MSRLERYIMTRTEEYGVWRMGLEAQLTLEWRKRP
jgi:hypothetical protein